MAWSPQQVEALDDVAAWLKAGDKPFFYLAGYAGTGKTTLAKHLADQCDGTVCFAAFTGKAALVMRGKGCTGASTIHSLIYNPEEDAKGIITFRLNHDSPVAKAKLVVVDECSMVDEKLGADLLSFKTPVLVLGDPFQLPPVSGTGYFTAGEPDYLLTEVHRQARDNPIIRLSMDVRGGKRLTVGTHGNTKIIDRRDVTPKMVLGADQVIVGRNKTRHDYNARIRDLLFQPSGPVPVLGEKLICLKNKHPMGLLNGAMWRCAEVEQIDQGVAQMIVDPLDGADTATSRRVSVPLEFFSGTENQLDLTTRRSCEEFTYGHAITCHKSQGSQWDKTMIFDEGGAFREDAQRWRYTAITRTAQSMIYAV